MQRLRHVLGKPHHVLAHAFDGLVLVRAAVVSLCVRSAIRKAPCFGSEVAEGACTMHNQHPDTLPRRSCNFSGQAVQSFRMDGGHARFFCDETAPELHHNDGGHGGSTPRRFMRVPRED